MIGLICESVRKWGRRGGTEDATDLMAGDLDEGGAGFRSDNASTTGLKVNFQFNANNQ